MAVLTDFHEADCAGSSLRNESSTIAAADNGGQILGKKLLWVLLGYALLTVVFTRPLAWQTGDGYIANLPANGDGSYIFNPYHLKNCIDAGGDCMHTDLQCFPIGNSLALNTNMPIPSLLAQFWTDTTQGLNIVLLLNCFLVALGGFLYARLWLRSDVLAFVAGALFAFWMGRSAHLWYGHANLMFAAPVPFALYALHRALPQLFAAERPLAGFRWTWALAFAAFSAITALHDLILVGFISIYAALMIVMVGYRLLIFPLKWYWQLVIVIGVVVLMDQWPQWMLRAGFDPNGAYYFSGSLKNFFYPHPVSAFYGQVKFAHDIGAETKSGFDMGRVMFGGILFMVFSGSILGLRLILRKGLALPWMLVLLGLGFLYTMPLIRWGNGRWLYAPFAVTHFFPGWNENRCPTRFADILMLVGPVWAMVNLERTGLWERWSVPMRSSVGLLLALLLLAEHVPQRFFFVEDDARPSVYVALQHSPEPAAMFVPFGLVDGKKAFGQMWLEPFAYQPLHQRKMHNGFLSRIDEQTFALFEDDTFSRRLVRNEWLEVDLKRPEFVMDSSIYAAPDAQTMRASLQKLQLRQIVVKPGMDTTAALRYLDAAIKPFVRKDTMFQEGHRLILLDW